MTFASSASGTPSDVTRLAAIVLEGPFAGHPGWVLAIAVSPDGRFLVSGGDDGTVRTWDADTGEARLTLTGHDGPVQAVAVTPDGRFLVSGGNDGTVRTWDADTGEARLTLTADRGWVQAVAVTPGGRFLVSGGTDGKVRTWDADTGEARLTLTGHDGSVQAVAITPGGSYLVSGGSDGTVRTWDADTGEVRLTLTGHDGWVYSVAVTPHDRLGVTPDAGYLVSGSSDGTIRTWDATTGEARLTLTGHDGDVLAVAATPDGRSLVSAGRDGTLCAWDADTGEVRLALTGHHGWVQAVAVIAHGRSLVSAGRDGTVRTWNASTGEPGLTLTGHHGYIQAVTATPDGRSLVTGGKDGTVCTWDADTGESQLALTGHDGSVQALAVTPGGRFLVSGGWDGTVRTWDSDTGEARLILTGHDGWVESVAVTPDGRFLVSGGWDGTVRTWETSTGRARLTLTGHDHSVQAVAVTPDGRYLVSGGYDGTVRTWDANTGTAGLTLTGHVGMVTAVAVTPDGRSVVTGGMDGTVRTWDADTGRARLTLTGHDGLVRAVAVTPHGRSLVSAGRDGTVRTWEAGTGELLFSMTGHTAPMVFAVTPIPLRNELVSVGSDGTIRIWDAATGDQLRGTLVDAQPPRQLADPLSDDPSPNDLLDIAPEVERMATLVVSSGTAPPLSIALLADWGVGKSSFMLQMQREIDRICALSRNNPGTSSYLANVRQVRFNAWHYSNDHVWAGIVQKLFEDLDHDPSLSTLNPVAARSRGDALRRKLEENQAEQRELAASLDRIAAAPSARRTVAGVGSPLGTALTFRAALLQVVADAFRNRWTLALVAVLVAIGALAWFFAGQWMATAGQWVAAVGSTAIVTSVAASIKTYRQVLRHAETVRTTMEDQLTDLRGQESDLCEQLTQVDAMAALSRFLDARAESAEYANYRGIVGQVHDHLEQLDRHLRAAGKEWTADPQGGPPIQRIILYIDDLDRCPPGRVVDVLAAVHLMLALPLFVVVVGVDGRWLRRSLDFHDQSMFGTTDKAADSKTSSDPLDYLDKIFQIPFALRPMNDITAHDYIRRLIPGADAELTSPGPAVQSLHQRDDRDQGLLNPNHPVAPLGLVSPQSGFEPLQVADRDLDGRDVRDVRIDVRGHRRVAGAIPVLRPVSLSLGSHEQEFLANLGALVATPRAAKKLVNLYRLVRIGVRQAELTAFAGAPHSNPYRAAGLLLAIVVGVPTCSIAALAAVLKAVPRADLITTLEKASTHDQHTTPARPNGLECPTCANWTTTLDAVRLIEGRSPGLPAIVDQYQQWAPEIARFSFHTRPLWAQLSLRQKAAAPHPDAHDYD